MKVGSLVELVNDSWDENRRKWLTSLGVRYPVKGKVYTVRGIDDSHSVVGILLEEIVNPICQFAGVTDEPGWRPFRFRELLPPTEIDLEEIICVTV